MSKIFTVVNDEVLESYIREADQKIVYVAPGVSKLVADAFSDRFKDLGHLSITIILDLDPEVYRLGYGDPKGLDTIKKLADEHFLELRQQPGVRIGLLIADNKTLIYTPTPRTIEAGSINPEKPNAIVLDGNPDSIDKACASGPENLLSEAEIGKKVVDAELLDKVKKDLDELPPKRFDLARIERVFNSRIQYVEFKIKKYKLSKKIAPIPPDLLGIADDPSIKDRWRNAFRMFDGADKIKVDIPDRDKLGEVRLDSEGVPITINFGEKELEGRRRGLERDFLYKVPGYGVVIFRSRRGAFDKGIEAFKLSLKDYGTAVQQIIYESINDTINRLKNVLMPLILEKTPSRYYKASVTGEIQDNEIAIMLEEDLRDEFGRPDEIASPEIKVQYKDIAYETIHDAGFKAALCLSGIPRNSLEQLFSEHDAAPETAEDP